MVKDKSIQFRKGKDIAFKGLIIFLTSVTTLPLLLVLYYIFKKGISAINWDFLVNLPKPVGEVGGGIYNAIIGSGLIILVACIIAVPFGVAIGVYLSEFKSSKLSYYAVLAVDVLQGVPSIVIGIVIYIWVVKPMGGFSALSGSIALSLIMLPTIVKSVEETLKLIPDSLKEASLALGVPYYKTVMKVIVPAGISGIMSGTILSIARIAGETAPLLFTALGNQFTNTNMLKPMSSLPLVIFNYAISAYPDWQKLAWGASFMLIVFIFILNILTKIAEKRWKVQL